MSQNDLATIFRRAMEAYSRGDYDAAVLHFDPAMFATRAEALDAAGLRE